MHIRHSCAAGTEDYRIKRSIFMKKGVFILAVLAAAVLASGCAGQGKEDAAASDTVEAPEESSNAEATEIIGMVKEISDSQISLVTGRPGPRGGGQGKGDAGKRMDGEETDGGPDEAGTDRVPDTQEAGDGPEKGAGGRPGRRDKGGETGKGRNQDEAGSRGPDKHTGDGKDSAAAVTILLSSSTEVMDSEGKAADIEEVKAGDMVCVETDAANIAVRITIKSGSGQMEKEIQ